MATIFNSLPLPLLLPRVDLRGKSYLAGATIAPNRQLIYSDFFTAAGLRWRTNNQTLSGNVPYFAVRSTSDPSQLLFCNSSSAAFEYYTYTGRRLIGSLSSTTPKYQLNDRYAAWVGVYSSWQTAWGYTPTATSVYQGFKVGGTNRYLYGPTVPDICDYEHNRIFASTSILNSNGTLLDTPQDFVWGQTDDMYTFQFAGTPDADALRTMHMFWFSNARVMPIGFAPRRPLRRPPTLIEERKVDQLVSLSGHSYRSSYCPRRIYEIELELDGSLPATTKKAFMDDPRTYWGRFVEAADAGVTLYIDRQMPMSFWRPRGSMVCADMPNMISGMLLDASAVRVSASSGNGIEYAYEVTIQIADETDIWGAPI